MLLEINLGLLSASAIVASLLNIGFEGEVYNRLMSYAVVGFGFSAISSTLLLIEIVRGSVLGSPLDEVWIAAFTWVSLLVFAIAAEIIVFVGFRRFRKKGKIRTSK